MLRRAVIAPSRLAADFRRLGEEGCDVDKAGADWVHIDVTDGRFAPSSTMGPNVVSAVRRVTKAGWEKVDAGFSQKSHVFKDSRA